MSLKTVLAAAMVVASSSAFASDLPLKSAPPAYIAPVSFYNWTGFYVGVNAGYQFSNSDKTTTTGTPAFLGLAPAAVPFSLKTGSDGFIGGAQIGYNYQINQFVTGIEADIGFLGNSKGESFTGVPVAGVAPLGLTTSASSKLDYLGTVRARIGYLATDRLLAYITGGLAYGNVKTNTGVSVVGNPAAFWSGSSSSVRAGYALGAGLEYAFTNNISLRGEYLYYDLGKQNTAALGNANIRAIGALNGVDYLSSTKTDGSIVRAALNYKF